MLQKEVILERIQRQLSFVGRLLNSTVQNNLANQEVVEFDWSTYKRNFKPWYILISLPTLIVVFLLVKTINYIPGMTFGFLTGLIWLVRWVNDQANFDNRWFDAGLWLLLFAAYWLVIYFFINLKFFPRTFRKEGFDLAVLAVEEEEVFRLNSEKWNLREKVASCVSFGLLHLSGLIIPLCIAVALIFPGAVFMGVYLTSLKIGKSRTEALRNSASIHTTYNLFAVLAIVLAFVSYFVGPSFTTWLVTPW